MSTEEDGRRLEEYGSNELASADGISPWEVLGNQFKNLLIVILLIATAIDPKRTFGRLVKRMIIN